MRLRRAPIRKPLLPALLLLLVAACAGGRPQPPAEQPAAASVTTVYVVRHAERAAESDRDSPLSEAGRERAQALADALEGAGVVAVYATQYRRTRETAAPLVGRLGLPVSVDSAGAGAEVVQALARSILTRHRGEAVLVVGHSNTVPAIVHALGGPHIEGLPASRYGDLFILSVPERGPVRTVRARFGCPE